MQQYNKSKTPDALIVVMDGDYSNDDAYYNVAHYIITKHMWGCYGAFPYDLDTIVQLFAYSKELSSYEGSRKLWHFSLTFTKSYPPKVLYGLANQIALVFAGHYQIIFSVDTEGTNHIHFCVNAFSYHPNTQLLSKDMLDKMFPDILLYVQQCLPGIHTTDHFFK